MKRLQNLIRQHSNILEYVFLICFGCYYTYIFMGTTMFDTESYLWLVPLYRITVIIMMLLVFVKFLAMKREDAGMWFGGIIMLACYTAIWLRSSDKSIFILGLFIIAAMGVSFNKIVQTALVLGTAIMVTAFIASQTGFIEDLVYFIKGTYRHSYGIIYSTDFGAHIFFLVLGYCFLRKGELKWFEHAAILLIAILLFWFCRARNNVICIALTSISLFTYQMLRKSNKFNHWGDVAARLSIVIIPLYAGVMILLSVFYDSSQKIWNTLNSFVTGRLYFGNEAFKRYGLSLFGKAVKGAGLARTTVPPEHYFAIDSSYVSILIQKGIFLFAAVCIAFIVCAYRAYKKKMFYALILLAVMGLQCVMEEHMLDISYNVFLLMVFADLDAGSLFPGKKKMGMKT